MTDAKAIIKNWCAAYDALRFYVDANDAELKERGMSRDDALRQARDAEAALHTVASQPLPSGNAGELAMDAEVAMALADAPQIDPNVQYGDGFHDGYLKGRQEGYDAARDEQPSGNAELPLFPNLQVPRVDADIDLIDIRRLAKWCKSVAMDYARAALAAQTDANKRDADIDSAAKVLAECMDYPWSPMPEEGRDAMRKYARRVIDAARKGASNE